MNLKQMGRALLGALFITTIFAACDLGGELDPPLERQYYVTVQRPTGGSLVSDASVIEGKTVAPQGKTVTITATPWEAYELTSITVKQGISELATSTTSPLSFTMPAADVTVSAVFTVDSSAASIALSDGTAGDNKVTLTLTGTTWKTPMPDTGWDDLWVFNPAFSKVQVHAIKESDTVVNIEFLKTDNSAYNGTVVVGTTPEYYATLKGLTTLETDAKLALSANPEVSIKILEPAKDGTLSIGTGSTANDNIVELTLTEGEWKAGVSDWDEFVDHIYWLYNPDEDITINASVDRTSATTLKVTFSTPEGEGYDGTIAIDSTEPDELADIAGFTTVTGNLSLGTNVPVPIVIMAKDANIEITDGTIGDASVLLTITSPGVKWSTVIADGIKLLLAEWSFDPTAGQPQGTLGAEFSFNRKSDTELELTFIAQSNYTGTAQYSGASPNDALMVYTNLPITGTGKVYITQAAPISIYIGDVAKPASIALSDGTPGDNKVTLSLTNTTWLDAGTVEKGQNWDEVFLFEKEEWPDDNWLVYDVTRDSATQVTISFRMESAAIAYSDEVSIDPDPEYFVAIKKLTAVGENGDLQIGTNTPVAFYIEGASEPEPEPSAITISPASGGTVSASATTALPFESVMLTITPEPGYKLVTLAVMKGTSPVTLSGANNTRYFSMPDAPVTVSASFEYDPVLVARVLITKAGIARTALTLAKAETAELSAIVIPSNASFPTVTWKTSAASIVTVDGGKITAVKAGSATITATTAGPQGESVEAELEVTVIEGGTVADLVYANPYDFVTVDDIGAYSLSSGKPFSVTVNGLGANDRVNSWHLDGQQIAGALTTYTHEDNYYGPLTAKKHTLTAVIYKDVDYKENEWGEQVIVSFVPYSQTIEFEVVQ